MTTTQVLERIRQIRALVVGDIGLDRLCGCEPETAVPEAGGRAACQAAALGAAEVAVLGVVGGDGAGRELEGALAARGVTTELLAPADAERELVSRLEAAAPNYDVVIVADRAEDAEGGVVTAGVREALGRLAQACGRKTTFWANSPKRPEHFRNLIVQAPRDGAREACIRAFEEVNYFGLRHITRAPLLMITHGGDGALIVHLRGLEWAFARSIANPASLHGAGDAFSAGAALALWATDDPRAAADFGNLTAEVTIMKDGAGTASPEEILEREANARFTRSVPSSPKISRW
jgi:bifunctional ADP-heptose synthase (sugar kinase/adenylyltransferase)